MRRALAALICALCAACDDEPAPELGQAQPLPESARPKAAPPVAVTQAQLRAEQRPKESVAPNHQAIRVSRDEAPAFSALLDGDERGETWTLVCDGADGGAPFTTQHAQAVWQGSREVARKNGKHEVRVKNERLYTDVPSAFSDGIEAVAWQCLHPGEARAAPKSGPISIVLRSGNARARHHRVVEIDGDEESGKVTVSEASEKGGSLRRGTLGGGAMKQLIGQLEALDWFTLESTQIMGFDMSAATVRIERAGLGHEATVYGGCSCNQGRRPTDAPEASCTCRVVDAIKAVEKAAADPAVALVKVTTREIFPAVLEVGAREKVTAKATCAERQPCTLDSGHNHAQCFATTRKGVVSCFEAPGKSVLAKLQGTLRTDAVIWAVELANGVTCVGEQAPRCPDQTLLSSVVKAPSGGWFAFIRNTAEPVVAAKVYWTAKPR